MDQKLKERLFGLAVLASVGVLVYPFLTLDKPKEPRLVLVPDMPAVQEDLGQAPNAQLATSDFNAEIERLQKEMDALDHTQSDKAANEFAASTVTSSSPNLSGAEGTGAQVAQLNDGVQALPVPSAPEAAPAPNMPAVVDTPRTLDTSEGVPFKIEDSKSTVVPKNDSEPEPSVKSDASGNPPKAKDTKKDKEKDKIKLKDAVATMEVNKVDSKVAIKPEAKMAAATRSVKGWTIQLGSFSNPEYARDLENKLKKGGYSAYTTGQMTGDGVLMKVMVGPQIKKEDANHLKTKIETNYAVKGLVVPYDPIAG